MGWLTIMIDTSTWSPEQHQAAKEEIALYKKDLRALIRDADLYHISARPDGVHWDGIEYWDAQRKHGVVYAFRGKAEERTHTFRLQGLQARKRYRLIFHDHGGADRTAQGQDLMRKGLKVMLALPNSSELVFLDELAQ